MIDSYVAVDLETTGLSAKTDKILEIGAVKVVKGTAQEKFSTFVNPHRVIPTTITELTGITYEDVNDAQEEKNAVADLIDFCEDYILLGHNLMFDYSFLKKSAVNNGIQFEKYGIDTLKIAKKLLPQLEKRSLEYLTKYYNLDHENKHRAYCDANASSLLYLRLKEEYFPQNERIFDPFKLSYKAKKENPITQKQISYLSALVLRHNVELDADINNMTRNEASRAIDNILSQYGKY